jgi:hypothetical protein
MINHTCHELHTLCVNLYSVVIENEEGPQFCYGMKGNLKIYIRGELH